MTTLVDKYLLLGVFHFICTGLVLRIRNCFLPSGLLDLHRQIADLLLFFYIARVTYLLARRVYFTKKICPKNKAVLITGCDTGFGHELAKRLDAQGFSVFAACLFPSGDGATALKETCSKNLKILELDVTKDESVKNALEFVKRNLENCELWAVVNNAGILVGFSIGLSTMSDFKNNAEVNTFGLVRVTRAFLPLLKHSKGRLVNLTSLAGRVSSPHIIPYTMSKCAAVAFSECLKLEMDFWGVRVISVEPELFNTALGNWDNMLKKFEESVGNMDENLKSVITDNYVRRMKHYLENFSKTSAKNIYKVTDALESAVSMEYPDSVYRPCRNFLVKTLYDIAQHVPRSIYQLFIKAYVSLF